jgi:hypothetical protein
MLGFKYGDYAVIHAKESHGYTDVYVVGFEISHYTVLYISINAVHYILMDAHSWV